MATDRALSEAFTRYVGERVTGEAKAAGLTVVRLSALMGMDRSTLSRYLKGARPMPLDVLYEAAQVIGIPVKRIIERAELDMTEAGLSIERAGAATPVDRLRRDRKRLPGSPEQ